MPQQDVERANVATLEDPLNVWKAMRSEDASKWEAAMQEEYDSLMANGTWELDALPKRRKSVACKWVFRRKKDASGEVVCYKARLVADVLTKALAKDRRQRLTKAMGLREGNYSQSGSVGVRSCS